MGLMRIAIAASLLLAATAGCSGTTTPSAGPPAGSPTTATASTPAASATVTVTVPETLKFAVSTVDGKPFDAASLAGKPVVLWFWAAWCPKCKGDAANVRTLQQSVSGKVHVVGVAGLGSGGEAMRKFVADYQLSGFPQLADDNGVVWKKFEVPSQHYYVVLDLAGKVVHRGPLSISQLQQQLAGLA